VDENFALVPEGFVSIAMSIFDQPGGPEADFETQPFLLARHAVTNDDYQLFVDAGAYSELELWPEELWPHLIDFKDLTGKPGPAYWQEGRYHRDLADHPVVGVCFFEAAAYSKWAGYRMPTEAEWQMAASWRIRSSAHVHRRYPWGDALDLDLCNIWASGQGGTLPVSACSGGMAPNGVLQLIGNTWEWVDADFEAVDRDGRQVMGDTLLKVIRGGAYDTYFPWQAVSAFRSGLCCVSRWHNVGFRCAMELP
jgi:iron(II)-dependent oxidoreductase